MKIIENFILIGLLIICPLIATADVDEGSIFNSARYPVSVLDLDLYNLEKIWLEHYARNPSEEIQKEHPLITKSRVAVQLLYLEDKIWVTAWIDDLDGFLVLSSAQRKKLVFDILDLVKESLSQKIFIVHKKTGQLTEKILENRHIKLSILINRLNKNDKNETIRFFLPLDIGVGQAGYIDGQFVFSEPYFLNLKVQNGMAVSGDASKFVFERE